MARIRTVKPEFYTHPEVLACSIPARLLLLSILNQADDAGRLYDQPLRIRGNSFGEEDRVNVRKLLEELVDRGRLCRYEAGDRPCLHVVNFGRHQTISHPSPSTIPPCPLPEHSRSVPGGLQEDSSQEGKGKEQGRERKGKEGRDDALARFEEFWRAYPKEGRRDKPITQRNFVAACRKADPDVIITSAAAYAADPNRDPGKTKYAQGWLSGERWNDPPLTGSNDNGFRPRTTVDLAIQAARGAKR